ncbi:MAG TPA: TIGR00159 family protein [Saprospiraceae bacterium]|nr:TIGR00159 family protein [Saprospiraceae bacterium]
MYLFEVGFINIRLLDILDILIVAYFFYLIYRLLKGTVAFNIILGVIVLYIFWWVVNLLQMRLLVLLLGKFVAFGVIILIIIFQPEVRKFLLYLGNSTLKGRLTFLNKYFNKSFRLPSVNLDKVNEIKRALIDMGKDKTGALIVFTSHNDPIINEKNGTLINGEISEELIESIFNKNSPLHDGAMLIIDQKIYMVGAILPVSSREDMPKKYGTRHRAAIGATEV